MKRLTQYIADLDESQAIRNYAKALKENADYIKSLQLTLTDDDLTDKQLKDFATRSRGIASSPARLSAVADVDAMKPNHLKQVIAFKRVDLFVKHRAQQRLAGKWK
jgi:hypothetical protein